MATKLDVELARARELVTRLEQMKAAEDTATNGITLRVKQLAVALHSMLCTSEHGPSAQCKWQDVHDFDDPSAPNWSHPDHQLWLQRAKLGVEKMIELGFTVTDPE